MLKANDEDANVKMHFSLSKQFATSFCNVLQFRYLRKTAKKKNQTKRKNNQERKENH